jgi:plasmid stabilization system protein ParE
MKVEISAEAEGDLEAISDCIARAAARSHAGLPKGADRWRAKRKVTTTRSTPAARARET